MVQQTTVFITGAAKGLGLGYVSHYANLNTQVIATARDVSQAKALQHLAQQYTNVHLYSLDAGNPQAIHALATTLGDHSIDLLISNAGVYPQSNLASADANDWLKAFQVNTLSTYFLAQAFLPHLKRTGTGKLIAMTSKMGSIADNTSGGSYIYRSSKAALNMVVKSLSLDLAADGITVAALHPGWVRTDMGGPHGLIDVATSIQGLTQVIEGLTLTDSGKCLDYTGKEIPW